MTLYSIESATSADIKRELYNSLTINVSIIGVSIILDRLEDKRIVEHEHSARIHGNKIKYYRLTKYGLKTLHWANKSECDFLYRGLTI